MVEERPMPISKVAGLRPAPVPTLTPKEVLGILRRHTLLIIALTVLGLVVGGGTWFGLKQYFPSYTARTYIEVLSPVERDPMTLGAVQVAKDIQYGYRLSLASIIKNQRTLQELCARDKVKADRLVQPQRQEYDKSSHVSGQELWRVCPEGQRFY